MKKLMLNAAAILFVGTLAVQAQTPSETTPSTTTPSQTTPSVQQQRPRSGDWTKVESSQVPAPVQQTLRTEKYKGWENDGVYFNKSTGQYSVDIRTGATPGLYYFDQSGRTVTASGTSPQQGATGSTTRPNQSAPNQGSPDNSSGSTVPPPQQSPTPNR